ncbi:MAG: ATP-binding protein [Ndongobacter sp.]|nr:ATP-binding protein [Ndongobacter sp.]
MAYLYSGTVTSEIASVCSLVSKIVEELKPALEPSKLFDLRLVLSELMINGCEHGNLNDRRKVVTLNLMVTDQRIDIVVRDEGSGFCYDVHSPSPQWTSCSGRGLRIVSSLCDIMEVKESMVRCVLYREMEQSSSAV